MKSDIRANRRPSSSRSLPAEKAGFYISPKSRFVTFYTEYSMLSFIDNLHTSVKRREMCVCADQTADVEFSFLVESVTFRDLLFVR